MKLKTSPSQQSYRTLMSAPALLVCSAVVLLAGCASDPESHVVSAPPPPAPTATVAVATPMGTPAQTAVAVPVPNAAPGTVIVMQAPPAAPPPEAIPARPSSSHVWVAGYYTWRNNRYEWMAGHWEVPPRSGSTWVPPRWEQDRSQYRFYEGYWN